MTIHHFGIGKDLDAFAADLSVLNDDIKARLMIHGLGQKLADARAGMNTKTEGYEPAKALAMVQKVWDNLAAGNWGRERGAGAGLNPVEARMRLIAGKAVRAAIVAKGLKVKDLGDTKVEELITGYVAKHEATLRDQAGAELAAEAGRKSVASVDLDDLGL